MSSKLAKWSVTASHHLLRDPWLKLRADSCVTQRGIAVDPFYVFEYPDWVHVIALDEEDRLLLVRQYRHGAGEFSLELPGGMMDEGETVVATAARELREETGYAADSFGPLVALSPNPSTHSNRIHGVLATGLRRAGEQAFDPSEDIEVERMDWREAADWAMRGGMINATQVGLLLIGLREVKGFSFGG
jgi:8-oxo-dGTP pyrophosphatase MutT (NUDIX family)